MICIDQRQRNLHVLSEGAAIVILAPFLAWCALRRDLPPGARAVAGAAAVATVLVDGYLLMRFLRRGSPGITPP